jgi:MFS superfamily sulfate permease-like transporter
LSNISKFKAKEFPGIKIIRYEESVYYANVDNFTSRIIKLVGIDPLTNRKVTSDSENIEIEENEEASLPNLPINQGVSFLVKTLHITRFIFFSRPIGDHH